MSSRKVSLALVGCGGIAGAHLKAYKDLHDRGVRQFEVTACCDISVESARARADQIAQFQGKTPAVFAGVEELVRAGAAEAADVCVPHCYHHSATLPLLDAGMHVLLEKPLGITVKASRMLIAAAERKGRILATAENIRRGLSARACRWALAKEQMIGEVPAADIQMVYNGQLNFADPKFKWRGVKLLTGGGMIMDSGAHFTDMMLCLFGEPESVYCEMQTRDPAPIQGAPVVGDAVADVEDTWFAVIRFRNGTRVNWTYSRVQPGPELKFGRYYGSNGIMEDLGNVFHAFQAGGRITLKDGTARGREWIEGEYQKSLSAGDRERLFPGGATDGFSIEVADFVRAVAGGGRVELDGRAGLAAKALCEACYESATAGKFVAYADVLDGKIDAFQKPINEFWKI